MAEALLNSENPNAKYTRVMDISVGSQLGAMSDPVN